MKKNALLSVLLSSACLLASLAHAQSAPTVTLTASPSSGAGSVTTTLTWSSTNAASCVASSSAGSASGWFGAKNPSGSQLVNPVTADTTYTLTCSAATGKVTLNWVAPTQNTDGSTLTDLAGYKVYSGANAGSLAVAQTISNPATLTSVLTGLSPGAMSFAVTATNSAAVESAKSSIVPFTVTPQSAAQTTTVTVSTQPNPPTGLTAQ